MVSLCFDKSQLSTTSYSWKWALYFTSRNICFPFPLAARHILYQNTFSLVPNFLSSKNKKKWTEKILSTHAITFTVCDWLAKKRANKLHAQSAAYFILDWLEFLIHIHNKLQNLHQTTLSVDVWRRFALLKTNWNFWLEGTWRKRA